jgi:hypothetical protein
LPVLARRRAAIAALIAALLVSVVLPSSITAHAPRTLGRFMHAMGQVESGGRYSARNKTSGAYGKYQILPSNWPSWAKLYLGNAHAKPTPRNQERVARGKFLALHRWLGAWKYVAHWWLTGSGDKRESHWSTTASRYVDHVMTIYHATGGGPRSRHADSRHTFGDTSERIHYGRSWSTARYPGYSNDRVRYAQRSGAALTFSFRGRTVSWIGPVGPTRGRARVYVDGKFVRTVDLHAGGFRARKLLFTKSWSKSHQHTLRILVASHARPVAVDELRVG